MTRIVFVGNVDPIASAVAAVLPVSRVIHAEMLRSAVAIHRPDLIIVAGWRHLIPPDVLAIPRLGTVGFHSAKLPEYPGRAPVPWAILRGDAETANTMLYLDEGVDSGDIIDSRTIPVVSDPAWLNQRMAETSVEMLLTHLPGLLAGTAPRTPQDMTRRGPLTTKDGWARLAEHERMRSGEKPSGPKALARGRAFLEASGPSSDPSVSHRKVRAV